MMLTDLLLQLGELALRTRGHSSIPPESLWLAPFVTGPVAGGGMYVGVRGRYRNQDAGYHFESGPGIRMSNLSQRDDMVGHRDKTSDIYVAHHDLSEDPRVRVHGRPADGGSGFFGLLS